MEDKTLLTEPVILNSAMEDIALRTAPDLNANLICRLKARHHSGRWRRAMQHWQSWAWKVNGCMFKLSMGKKDTRQPGI
jgi:hypothetical protein